MSILAKPLEKLKITAYPDAKRQQGGKDFEFSINPDEFKSRHENRFSKLKSINTSGRKADYAFSVSDTLSLTLIVDATLSRKYLPEPITVPEEDVTKRVKDFLANCFYMDGDLHQPRFLTLSWGNFQFECRLQAVDVAYSLYNDAAEPRRAELKAVFIADMDDDKRLRMVNKKSPDVTHERIFSAGDTLPLLAKQIYGDAAQYLMVAAYNGLDDFRNIPMGTTLYFPPLQPKV